MVVNIHYTWDTIWSTFCVGRWGAWIFQSVRRMNIPIGILNTDAKATIYICTFGRWLETCGDDRCTHRGTYTMFDLLGLWDCRAKCSVGNSSRLKSTFTVDLRIATMILAMERSCRYGLGVYDMLQLGHVFRLCTAWSLKKCTPEPGPLFGVTSSFCHKHFSTSWP